MLIRFQFSLCLAATLVLLLGDHQASAQSPKVEEAKQEFLLGAEAFQATHYRQALRHYRQAYQLANRPRVLYNIAVCELELRHNRKAGLHFYEFLDRAEARDADLVKKAKEHLRKLGRNKKPAVLALDSDPSGAHIFLNDEGTSQGTTPLELRLSPGPYTIRAKLPGTLSNPLELRLAPGSTTTESIVLERLATIVLSTVPADATIRPAQQPVKAGKGRLRLDVLAGSHEFKISHSDHETMTVRIDVEAGETVERNVNLESTNAAPAIRLHANVSGAVLSIDASVVATTRPSSAGIEPILHVLSPGQHVLTVERPGYTSWSRRVSLDRGDELDITLELHTDSGAPPSTRVWGLGGVGVASFATGAVYGALALRDEYNGAGPRTDDRALKADVLMGAGLVAAGAAYLLHRYEQRSAATAKVERRTGASLTRQDSAP